MYVCTIKSARELDPETKALKTAYAVRAGWPSSRGAPLKIRDYFSFKDESFVHDGLAFKGDRLVVLASDREDM